MDNDYIKYDNIEEYQEFCRSHGRKLCVDCSYCIGSYGINYCKAGIVGTIRDDSTGCYKFN